VRIGAIVRTAMRFRLELFVEDLDTSVAFYERALGFRVARREPEYASLRRGDAELGLAPITKLPVGGAGPGFTQERVARDRGAGVEIVLEVEDLAAAADVVERAGVGLVEPPRERPWGLRDFRLADPDGYYLRVTTRLP
jgi:catechol 2,3-dioxygenase-like lactoylglutathione lyase family enzyme